MISRLILRKLERKLQLDPPLTRRITVQRNLRIPMPDGVELLADRWLPRSGGDGLPTALLRTPTAGARTARSWPGRWPSADTRS